MKLSHSHLGQSLQTGFIDHRIQSRPDLLPQLYYNNKEENVKFLGPLIRELEQCDNFWMSVAFVTTGGVATIINTLIALAEKGVPGKVLVSSYLSFTQPDALRRLLQFKNIDLRIAIEGSFHSKGYLFQTGEFYNLIIGSSNLTATALCVNKEWNLKVSLMPDSALFLNAHKEFQREFEDATVVDDSFLSKYEITYNCYRQYQKSNEIGHSTYNQTNILIKPNTMQTEALENIQKIRDKGENKALLISATGTGKTYFAAFDVKRVNPKRFLFIVHRLNIAETAKRSFEKIMGGNKSMGIYSGDRLEMECDYLFATVQTISKREHFSKFAPDCFDYIVIDESHRAGADSYQTIFNYFKPKFALGMTATPERTDGYDIFKLFDHNIAYEIRLHKALEEGMLSPFHYYGVTDISVNGKILEENSSFGLLTSADRVRHIISKVKLYGWDTGRIRGLVFCSRKQECDALASAFNANGYRTKSLTGDSSEDERVAAIRMLESDDPLPTLDYIFTVDIFNEGIDIPCLNQIILLRPTQSAIIFVQQLGRGLRKNSNKDYLTVIDFIGNYQNNFLIPIALYGDTSYNKDRLRKCVYSGSSQIPGESTVNFDEISKKRILDAITNGKLQLKADLTNDYKLVRYQLGRIPRMCDFLDLGQRDPRQYVDYAKSYYNFIEPIEPELQGLLNSRQKKYLEIFSLEVCNGKRVEEALIIRLLLSNLKCNYTVLYDYIKEHFYYEMNQTVFESAIGNLNFHFATEKRGDQILTINEIHATNVVQFSPDDRSVIFSEEFALLLRNTTFSDFLSDLVNSSIIGFGNGFRADYINNGFVYYRKYSRKDVLRILCWKKKQVEQNIGGYIVSPDKTNCPLFVTLHKKDDISPTIKFLDGFINSIEFEWMSKSKRNLQSPDVCAILTPDFSIRLPLFIQKNNDEGLEFYYVGDVKPDLSATLVESMPNGENKPVSVVKIKFKLDRPVEDDLYHYLLAD